MNERSVARSEFAILFRAILWLLQGVLGATVGYLIADATVTTHVTIVGPIGRGTTVHVDVRVFDNPIQEETRMISGNFLDQPGRLTVSTDQRLIVFGLLAGGVLLGAAISIGMGILLVRKVGAG